MTLDEIIAGMEHLENLKQIDGDRITGVVKQLAAFRAELEEIAQKWNEEADRKYLTDARFAFQETATELRTKIGEKR